MPNSIRFFIIFFPGFLALFFTLRAFIRGTRADIDFAIGIIIFFVISLLLARARARKKRRRNGVAGLSAFCY